MPKRVKTVDLTKLSPTCNEISFEINKLDTLHLEIETGEVIKSDTKVELFIMKPNNQLVSETITTISDSTVKVDVKNGALDVAGIAIGRIKLSDSDGIVSTAPFYFTINDSFTNDEAIINSVGAEIFEDLLNRLEIVESSAQVAQIKANKTDIATLKGVIGDSSSGLVKAVTDNASQLDTKASKSDVAKMSGGTPLSVIALAIKVFPLLTDWKVSAIAPFKVLAVVGNSSVPIAAVLGCICAACSAVAPPVTGCSLR